MTLEQMVCVNKLSEEESDWTFGQILALFVLLGVVVEVINILLSKLDSRSRVGVPEDGDTNLSHPMSGGVGNQQGMLLENGSIV